MSKPIQTDTPVKSSSTEATKQPRLDLQEQIQRAITLATQLRHAASKEHLDSKEWTANQAVVNELLRTFDDMHERALDIDESIEGLILTQIRLEVKIKMDALSTKIGTNYPLAHEIKSYLAPEETGSRE